MDLNLSEIESSIQRKRLLKRIYIWAAVSFILAVGMGLVQLYSTYKLYEAHLRFRDIATGFTRFQTASSVIVFALRGIAVPIQAFFFYRFVAGSKKAVFFDDSNSFTRSLEWLLTQTIIGTCLFVISAVWSVINLL
jgi:hypothetical protein